MVVLWRHLGVYFSSGCLWRSGASELCGVWLQGGSDWCQQITIVSICSQLTILSWRQPAMLRFVPALLALLGGARAMSCPPDCYCAYEDHFECEGDGVTLTASRNKYVHLECARADVACAGVPRVDAAGGALLPRLTTRRCPARLLACALRAANATRVTDTLVRDPPEAVRAEDLQDLNTANLDIFGAPPDSAAASTQLDLTAELARRFASAREINLSGGSLQRLTAGVFAGQFLEKIKISSNSVPLTLENRTFADLPALRTVLLDNSHICSVPGDLLRGSTSLELLRLSKNQLVELPNDLFQGLDALKTLDLSDNRLKVLTAELLSPLLSLVDLNLNNNRIRILPENLFFGLYRLQNFWIDRNGLEIIDTLAFQNAETLVHVSMNDNRLTFDPPWHEYIARVPGQLPFYFLVQLRSLELRGNRLRQVPGEWRNVVHDMNPEHELKLHPQVYIDLRNNTISTIIFNYLQPPPPAGQPRPQPMTTLLLDDNPFTCDCRLYNFTLALRGWTPRKEILLPYFNLGNARCASPIDKKGQLVTQIKPDQLTCDIPQPDCPSPCHCVVRPSNHTVELDCDYLPKNWSSIKYHGVRNMKLLLRSPIGLSTLPKYLQELNLNTTLILSHLSLHEIPFIELTNIEALDLRNNLFITIPTKVLNSGISLYLSGNALECSCSYKNVISEIRYSNKVVDILDIICSDGQKIMEIGVDGLCTVRDASIVAGGVALVLIILTIIATFMVIKHKQEILVYLTSRGYLTWLFTEEIVDADKLYDVFVSFSHQDADFVLDELMPKLEGDFGLKVCVHYRDWIVGDMIPLQIVSSVEQSRRTVIVLSRHFLSSMWAKLEFRAAHSKALREGRARVVLVVCGDDVVDDERVTGDEELRAYVSTNTYLKRDDARFWERLRRALPPRERKFTFVKKWRNRRSGEGEGETTVTLRREEIELNDLPIDS